MSDHQPVKSLKGLHRICVAGERGFETVAENVSNRGLKILLRGYARQRQQFAAELATEIERLGGELDTSRTLVGMIHRGRIDIFATLTIGPQNVERVVLREAAVGEKAALQAYEKVLQRADLPDRITSLLQKQYEAMQATSEQIEQLKGRPGERLVVRLFAGEQDVIQVTEELKQAGFAEDDVDTLTLAQLEGALESRGSALDETILSGAVGGAIWVTLLGAISGALMILTPGVGLFGALSAQSAWALVTIGGTLVGAIMGAILGFLISVAIQEEDSYLSDSSPKEGGKLVMLHTNRRRAPEASRIMQQIELRYSSV